MQQTKPCCDNCTRLLIGNICRIDNVKIADIGDTYCDEHTACQGWSFAEFRHSFHLTKNYRVMKHLRDNWYLVDRLYKRDQGFYSKKELIKMEIPLFHRGTKRVQIDDIVNINQQGLIQCLGNIMRKV